MRLAKLIPVDAKLDLLLKAARLEYDPLGNLPGDVVKVLQAGQTIDAIKRYREIMSVSLAKAKSVIEAQGIGLRHAQAASMTRPTSEDWSESLA
jgi:ribosomal protein L7/L12